MISHRDSEIRSSSGSTRRRRRSSDASLGEYRVDFIVDDLVVLEVKSVERLSAVFDAQVMNYLRLSGKQVGLLINFNSRLVKDGIKRIIV